MKSHGDHQHDLNIKKVDRLGATRVRLTVEFPGETVSQHEKATANRYLQAARIPGFRPGKAPLKMVRERYREEIQKDVVSHLLEAGLAEALEKTNLNPVNRPEIKLGEFSLSDGKPFEFHAEFEVEPEIELRNYKGVPLKKSEIVADEEEVTKTLENLRDRMGVLEPLEAPKAEKGNFTVVEIGYELTSDPSKKEARKAFTVEAGEGRLLPELDAALMEMKVGEERKVTGKFPEDYDDKVLAGKEAAFDLKLLELKRKVLPELDDAFASQIKEGATVESLKTEIRDSILTSKREDESRNRRNEVMEYLIKHHPFEVPNSLVERQAYSLFQWMQQDLKQKGFHPSQLKEEDVEAIKKRAEHMVRSSLLLKEIATKEKIALDQNKFQARVDAIAEQMNRTPEDTEKFLEGKGMLDRLKDEVLTDQVFDFLLGNAMVEG